MLVLHAGIGAMAQQAITFPSNKKGDTYIKFSPPGLINVFDGNLMGSAEYCLNKNWSVNMEAGYIFYSLYAPRTNKTSGIILRPSVRGYLNNTENLFLELQFHYKKVRYKQSDSLSYEATATTPAYGERTVSYFNRKVTGIHVIGGIKAPLDDNRRFWLELYLGLGIHFKWQQLQYNPNSVNKYENKKRIFAIHNYNGEGVPAFPAGVRLVCRIGK